MNLLQLITGQLRKHTAKVAKNKWPHICSKRSQGNNQCCTPARLTFCTHSQTRAFLRGVEYTVWGQPNPKSPCLNLAGSDVLHCFVTRLLQIPSIPCWRCYIHCYPIIRHAQVENYSLPFYPSLLCRYHYPIKYFKDLIYEYASWCQR